MIIKEPIVNRMIFEVPVSTGVFLTLVNRSFYFSINTILLNKNNLVPNRTVITIAMSGIVLYIKPIIRYFSFGYLNFNQLFVAINIQFLSVIWYKL